MADNKDYRVERALDTLLKLRTDDASNIRVVKIDRFDGEYEDYPENLAAEVIKVYKEKGIGTPRRGLFTFSRLKHFPRTNWQSYSS
jgi:hypothetical protein